MCCSLLQWGQIENMCLLLCISKYSSFLRANDAPVLPCKWLMNNFWSVFLELVCVGGNPSLWGSSPIPCQVLSPQKVNEKRRPLARLFSRWHMLLLVLALSEDFSQLSYQLQCVLSMSGGFNGEVKHFREKEQHSWEFYLPYIGIFSSPGSHFTSCAVNWILFAYSGTAFLVQTCHAYF